MQSVLIISHSQEKLMEKTDEILTQEAIDVFDRLFIKREEVLSKTGTAKQKLSIGIEDVKNLQKSLSLKPFKGDKKAIIIPDAHLLTIEAQNALLKVLEEPPHSTIIILLSETKDALLPTIQSRCKIIMITNIKRSVELSEYDHYAEIVDTMRDWGIGKALREAELLSKNKETALNWIENVMLVSRQKLLQAMENEKAHPQKRKDYLTILTSCERTRNQIKTTNVNLRLALENLLLHYDNHKKYGAQKRGNEALP